MIEVLFGIICIIGLMLILLGIMAMLSNDEFGGVIVFIGIVVISALIVSYNYSTKISQDSAIKAGHAKYIVNDAGVVTFVWNQAK